MRNAGLGTTTPISSWVQNCNSRQSLSLAFSWSLVEEVSAGSRSLFIPCLREGARHSASAAKPGRSLHSSFVPSSELGGRCPLAGHGVPCGHWDLRSGTDFQGESYSRGEQGWEQALPGGGIPACGCSFQLESRVQPQRETSLAKWGWAWSAD